MKLLAKTGVLILVLAVFTAAGLWFAKSQIESEAKDKTDAFLEKAESYATPAEKLLNSTLFAYQQYQSDSKKPAGPWASLRPYLTCEWLPSAVRVSDETFETAYPTAGNDNGAVQLLSYVLQEQGIETEHWDVISPRDSKKAVVAKLSDGNYKYLDPVSGVLALYNNQVMIGPYAARHLMMDNLDHRKLFVKIDESSDLSFYEDFAHVMIAPPGFPLYVSIAAPVLDEPLMLGELDGSAEDVIAASAEWQLTPYLNYLGQKHGPMVQRSIFFTEAAKITFVLTAAYDDTLATANIEPIIDGNTVTFEIPAEEALIFDDGKAPEGAFIDVDQIIIEQL